MRRGDQDRHPFFEWTVFAMAVVLAVILAFYGARRLLLRRVPNGGPQAAVPLAPPVPAPAAAGSATETAVTAIPPVRLSSMGGQRRWKTDVPAPHSSSKPKK
ncbi:MAG: hypothetical protein HY926_02670 [Elusimicrobia bacterium]|nr:hypothetical protein [Elusimicrobiota bacterium]